MTQSEIDKSDNELIATFNGLVKVEDSYLYKKPDGSVIDCRDFQYHTSWDWLMPVVEKIDALDVVTTSIFKTHVVIRVYKSWESTVIAKEIVYHHNPTPKIQAVYKAVVEFIKWYNNSTKDGK